MPYIGGVGVYRESCDEVAAKGYEGFALTPAGAPVRGAGTAGGRGGGSDPPPRGRPRWPSPLAG